MAIDDTNKLLVNDGSKTETITFAQFKDGTVLNDSDKFLINNGTKTETVTWAEIEKELGPKGVVVQPTVLKPKDGAGSGEEIYLKTDTITSIEGGGINTCETDTIQSVESVYDLSNVTSTESINTPENAIDGNPQTFASVAGAAIRVTPTGKITVPAGYSASIYCSMSAGESNVVSAEFVNAGVKSQTYDVSAADYYMPIYENTTGADDEIVYYEQKRLSASGNPAGFSYITGIAIHPNGEGPYVYTDADLVQYMVQPGATLTFPSSKDFDCFPVGTVVQSDWDQGYIWSNYLFDPGSGDVDSPERAFNGDLTNAATSGAYPGGTESLLTFTLPDGLVFDGKVEANLAQGGSISYFAIRTDKGDYPMTVTGTNTKYDISAAFNLGSSNYFTIVHDNSSTHSSNLSGVWINGLLLVDEGIDNPDEVKVISQDEDANTITVDGGTWIVPDGSENTDRDWSQNVDVAVPYTDFPASNGFDGNITTQAVSEGAEGFVINFDPPLAVTSSVEVLGGSGSGDSGFCRIDGANTAPVDFPTNATSNGGPFTPIYSGSGSLEAITIRDIGNSAPNDQCGFTAVRIDGRLLVNQGFTKLVKETPYGTTLTVAGPTDLARMSGSIFMTDGAGAPGPYSQTPYKLVTSEIESVETGPSFDTSQTSDFTDPKNAFDSNENTAATSGQFLYFTLPSNNNTVEVLVENTTGSLIAFYIQNDTGYANGKGTWDVGTTGWSTSSNQIDIPANSGKGTITFTNTATDKTIGRFYAVSPGVKIYTIKADGKAAGTTLTFADPNPDLQYFLPGDVVQGEKENPAGLDFYYRIGSMELDGAIRNFKVPLNPENAVDGDPDSRAQTTSDDGGYAANGIDCVFPNGFGGPNGEAFVKIATSPGVKMAVNGDFDNSFEPIYDANSYVDLTDKKTGKLERLTYWATSNAICGIYGFMEATNNSNILNTGGVYGTIDADDPVRVLSTDLASNSMVVDGGDWGAYDTSQVWSSGTTTGVLSFDSAWSNAFDGIGKAGDAFSPNTLAGVLPGDGPASIAFPTPLQVEPTDVIEVVAYYSTQTAVDTSTGVWLTGSSGEVKVPFVATGFTYISAILMGANVGTFFTGFKMLAGNGDWTGVAKISINGRVLLNPVNNSQVWSSYGTGTPYSANNGWINSFDGNNSATSPTTFAAAGQTMTWTPDSPIPVTVSATFYLYNQTDGSTYGCKVNGDWLAGTNNYGVPVTKTAAELGGNLTSIELVTDGSPVGAYLTAVEVDGQLLVDKGINGNTNVKYQTNGGHGEIVSVNIDDNKLLINNTGDRDNRWIAENKAGTDFAVAGPSYIDEPLLTTHVELESSQFATIPEGVDGLKEIIWNINGVDQSAGTNNPYRPTGLPLNSLITIKVKQIANSIGESEWSTSTTFTTGASFTLKEHYIKEIRELEKQLAAAQGGNTRSVGRRRARNADGTYRGDDPSTPDVNEAWEDG